MATGGVSGKEAHKTRRFLFMYNFLQPHYPSPLIPSATAFMRLPIFFFCEIMKKNRREKTLQGDESEIEEEIS